MAMRLYELSKKLGLTNKELIALLSEQGITLTSLASVSQEVQDLAHKLTQKSTPAKKVSDDKKSEEPVTAPVKAEKVQSVKVAEPAKKVAEAAPKVVKPVAPPVEKPTKTIAPEPLAPDSIVIQPMTVGAFAGIANVLVSEVIIALLKKGIVAPVTHLLSEETVADLAKSYNLTPIAKTPTKEDRSILPSAQAEGEWRERLPIVVVIGHVDHGKTSLLDFIRKTRVAAREKGGITQHLGAYKVKTSQGAIVFLDTPGHEAFSLMRVRGIKVADIAVVIIAADDGIKPQTDEAIKAAQAADIPMIIAVNKVDKASPAQIEAVKTQLSQRGIVAEDWGGQAVVMPISAKTGQGVDALLEVLVLQSQIMELKANMSIPAQGYILESKIEKGRGPVATVICQHGTLKVGDYFVAGESVGRVSSMVDSLGERVISAEPSMPVQVAGLSQLAHAGDIFEVHNQKDIKKAASSTAQQRSDYLVRKAGISREADINILLKTDNVSSREAVSNALSRLSTEECTISIIQSGVGDITASDVLFAVDTKAMIYGFHVKVQPNAFKKEKKNDVKIKVFDIIYKLIEDLEAQLEARKPVKMITKKIGEAIVLKVFDIKNLGIIAGSQVKEGRCSKNCKVKIYRGRAMIGEGVVKGLQRDRKTVKEVHAGFECGLLIDGFNTFEPDDRIECFEEIPAV